MFPRAATGLATAGGITVATLQSAGIATPSMWPWAPEDSAMNACMTLKGSVTRYSSIRSNSVISSSSRVQTSGWNCLYTCM